MTRISRPIALTIGVFDGLHRGHQAVVKATVRAARERSGIAWVTTFDPHPDTIVRGAPPRPWITTPEEREELLHAMGVDRVHVVRFDREIQALPPEGFLDRILGPGAPLAMLVVGPDFRMGKDRVGDRAYLESLGRAQGFDVRQVDFLMEGGEGGGKLSSTALRRLIETGAMEAAAAMMGRPYSLRGRVGSGAGRGSGLGYPTANLEVHPEKLLPAPGIYVSLNHLEGETLQGMTYVGTAETFGPGPVRVEVHLLDYEAEATLRGRVLSTSLVHRLRPDQVFESADALVRAMDEDRARTRGYWRSKSPSG